MNTIDPQTKTLCGKFLKASQVVEKPSSEVGKKSDPTSHNQLAAFKNHQLQRTESSPALIESKQKWNVSQVIKHQGGDHTFRNVLLFLVLSACIIFAVDLYKEMHQEKHELELKRTKCYEQYRENECQTPFDAIKDRCHQLQVCFRKDPEMTLRTSQIASKLIGKIISAFLRQTSIWGALFLLLIFGGFLFFIWGHSRSTATQQTTLKKA